VFTENREELESILAEAQIPPLLPTLAYLTGDMSLLREEVRPDPELFGLEQGGLSLEQQAVARELALETILRWRDAGAKVAAPPSPSEVQEIMEFAVGGAEMADYVPLLEEELAAREDRRAPRWRKEEIAPGRSFRVVIIGAGMSGLLAAYRLQQAGIEFTIFEKNPEVGGTWFENRYPGCRVDNPNHNYSYSFAQRHDWPYHFSSQPVLLDYFQDFAKKHDLIRQIRFETEVSAAAWSDAEGQWSVSVSGPDGEDTIRADALISAVGQLNRPMLPEIPGLDDFAGPSFHSAEWNPDIDLRGKRVAVIGTGASAMQLIPEIAEEVSELQVYQRTPAWIGPTPEYHDEVPEGLRWLYANLPFYSEWNRFCIFWRMGDGTLDAVRVDPEWQGEGKSVSERNDQLRLLLTLYIQEQFADRPDLLAKVLPDYPPAGKRLIRDNGVWADALKRDDVELVTDPISKITEDGIVTEGGVLDPVDVLIFGTGFHASKFLLPMKITGRGSTDLHEVWAGDARAYLGLTIPDFPNFFCLYGPNTNIVVNGSIIYFSECGVRSIMSCIQELLRSGAQALDVRREVHDAFNEEVDAENRRMAWGVAQVNSWYRNELGRIAQNWPFTLLEYWKRTRAIEAQSYRFLEDGVWR